MAGILNNFLSNPSSDSLGGATPSKQPGANPGSTLHIKSSINNDPTLSGNFPAASSLDLDGNTPAKYANPETGGTYS